MSDIEDIRRLLEPGMNIYVAAYSGEPVTLLALLSRAATDVPGLTYIQQPLAATNTTDLSTLSPEATLKTFFMTPYLREGLREGRVEYVPMHMRSVYRYLATQRIDVALLQAARDRNGVLRYGPNVDFLDAVLENSRYVLVEENAGYIAPTGTREVDRARVDLLVPANSSPPYYQAGEPDEISSRIGEQIAALIHDGDCLQTGIGAVPAAVLANLRDRNDLGFHGGLIDESVMTLIANGNLTGKCKAIDSGRYTTGIALGSEKLFAWLAQESGDEVLFRSANYTHDALVISQLDNFVSINSAIEIDLMGQVNAEVAGGKQISGTGGSVDFMRAARMSRGGRSIVAMSSTARSGSVSRIVPRVEVVTALRTDIDIVVTEYGVAELRNESLKTRAEKLIEIAHPDFRGDLQATLRSSAGTE